MPRTDSQPFLRATHDDRPAALGERGPHELGVSALGSLGSALPGAGSLARDAREVKRLRLARSVTTPAAQRSDPNALLLELAKREAGRTEGSLPRRPQRAPRTDQTSSVPAPTNPPAGLAA